MDEQGSAIVSDEKRDEAGRFIVPPVSPGRPKGSRNKLGEQFLSDLMADWTENGIQAIKDTREKNPADYVKIVAATLPKELNVKVGELDDLTDDQLARQLAGVLAELANAGLGIVTGTTEAGASKQAGGVSTLQ